MSDTKTSMMKVCLMAAGLTLLGWMTSSTAMAAKADGPKAKFFAKYDKNHNGVIDADEKDAIRKDYAAKPDGELKRFDKNKDGKLDDEEIAAIKPPTGKGKAARGDNAGGSGKKADKQENADKTEKAGKADKTEKTEKADK